MTSQAQIVTRSVHTVFSDTKVSLGYFLDGVEYRPAGTFYYPLPCSRGGSVAYDIAVAFDGTSVNVCTPFGDLVRATDAEFPASLGGFMTFENYANTNGETLPQFYAISAR